MNYQQLDTQPFVPSQAGQRAAAIRRRLMEGVRYAKPSPPPVETRKRIVGWFGVDHDQHVKAWEKKRDSHAQIAAPPQCRRGLREITTEVLENYPGVKLDDLKGKARRPDIVRARGEAMSRIRQERGDSYGAIGRFFGERSGPNVCIAVKKFERMKHAK